MDSGVSPSASTSSLPSYHSGDSRSAMTPIMLNRTMLAREQLQRDLLDSRIRKWGWCLFFIRVLSMCFGIALIATHHERAWYSWSRSLVVDVVPGVLSIASATIALTVDICHKSGFKFFCFQTIIDLFVLSAIMFGMARFAFCGRVCAFTVPLIVLTLELWVFSLLLVAFDVVQTVEYHRYKLQARSTRRPSDAFTEVVRDILSTHSAGPIGGAVLGDMQEGFRRLPPGQNI